MPNEKGNYIKGIEAGIENVARRPFDMYVLGPFLIWYGLKSKSMPPLSRKIVVTAGIWQLFYNWRKYREIPGNIAKLSEFPKLLSEYGKTNS